MSWKNYEPPTVPSGNYIVRIKGEPVEKPSQFKPGSTFDTVQLELKSENGQFFLMEWAWTPKTYIYKQLLLILGGKEMPSGHVQPPTEMTGRKFKAKVIERPAKNDKTKLVNEIIDVSPYESEKETPPLEEPEHEKNEVPF